MTEYMTQFTHSTILELNVEQQEAIRRLKSFRDQFIHFKPMSYGITTNEEWIITDVVDVIEFLALDCGNVFYYDPSLLERVRNAIVIFRK